MVAPVTDAKLNVFTRERRTSCDLIYIFNKLATQIPKNFAILSQYYSEEKIDHMYAITNINNKNEYQFQLIFDGFISTCSDALPNLIPLYSYFNTVTCDHFLTTDYQSVGIDYPEIQCFGIIGYVFPRNSDRREEIDKKLLGKPVYRYFLNRVDQDKVDHFYTQNPDTIGTSKDGSKGLGGYVCEGIGWYSIKA